MRLPTKGSLFSILQGRKVADQTINWYPGHMARARRELSESVRLVDVVAELADARAPESTRNPVLEDIWKEKAHFLVLMKADLADPKISEKWIRFYKGQGICCIAADAKSGLGVRQIAKTAESLCREKREKQAQKGMKPSAVRLMVAGVPNVGKSTLINQMAGRRQAARTGGKPGVTRQIQWIRLTGTQPQVQLLDTPGLLWPKIESRQTSRNLCLLGAVSDELLDTEELAMLLLQQTIGRYAGLYQERYHVSQEELSGSPAEILEAIGRRRGFLRSGARVDDERTAAMLIDEFRQGKLGRISLEEPNDQN